MGPKFNKRNIFKLFVLLLIIQTAIGFPIEVTKAMSTSPKDTKRRKYSTGYILTEHNKNDGNAIAVQQLSEITKEENDSKIERRAEKLARKTRQIDAKRIEDQVRGEIAEQLDVAKADVTLDANIIDDLGADSLSMVEIVLAMEEKFQIDIPDEDAEKLKTVRDYVTYIQTHIPRQ